MLHSIVDFGFAWNLNRVEESRKMKMLLSRRLSKDLCYLRHGFDDRMSCPTQKMKRNEVFTFFDPRDVPTLCPDIPRQAKIYNMRFSVSGSGFWFLVTVYGFWFMVYGLRFMVYSLWFSF